VVNVNGSGNSFASTAAFTGGGNVFFNAATTFNGSISAAGGFTLAGGAQTYTFSGVTFTGSLLVDNAFLTGALTLPAGSSLSTQNVNGFHIGDGLTLTNNGTLNLPVSFFFRNAGGVTNGSGANVNLAGDVDFRWDGNGIAASLTNNGTITKTAGTG